MTTPLSWPDWLSPISFEIGLQRSVIQHKSSITGTFQSVDLGVEFWAINLSTPPRLRSQSGRDEAFFNQLIGGAQPVTMWHFTRPEPRGTMRGTPTLASAVSQFSRTLQINTTGTLLAGDMIGIGGQLIQIAADSSPIGGVLTVQTVNRIRSSQSIGAAVIWQKPSANFVVTEQSSAFVHGPSGMAGSSFSFIESI